MAIVKLILDWKDPSWVTDNTDVLAEDEVVFLTDGRFSRGDGVTQVQNLTWLGGSSSGLVPMVHSHITQFNIIDNTYHYFGLPGADSSINSLGVSNARPIAVPVTGTITTAIIMIRCGNVPSLENNTLHFIGASTDTIKSDITLPATYNSYVVTGLSIAVTQGQLCNSALGNATYATNPTGVHLHVQYLIQPT